MGQWLKAPKQRQRVGLLSATVYHVIDSKYIPGKPDQLIYDEGKEIAHRVPNLLTTAGKDYFHNADYVDTAATKVATNIIALTESTITPAVGDTSLSGEIVASGLQRVVGSTLQHTPGGTTLIEKVFTASGSFTDVKASALFNVNTAPVSGTMAHEANFTTGSGTLISGDQLDVSWVMTLA